ncbi:hypothetical protein KAR91_63185, partial [Candidatus Pacearchaeota archaeon]|nr:hypothetical protein [Candidatus Pacearchaeota archaeon]
PGLGFEEMSNRSIEANITRASDIILWDWGVYIHKDNIDVDSSILAEALQWLDKKFKSGSRRVSLWGFFVENAKKCRKKGVPNEHALHTCMRSKYAEGFAFKKSPHVYPKHQKKRLTIEILIEDALIDSDGGVHKSELINRLGVKEYQVDQAISRMENICRDAQGGLYHIESFSASEELKKFFYNKLFEAIEKFTHISVKQIYNDNIISCKKAGIKDDRVLYSILSIYFSDDFSFVRYPYVLEKNHGIEDDGALSLNDIVKDYFIKQKGVVHHKDLHNYFVTERHYNPRRIDAIQYLCDNIVKYSRGAFVSLEQIEWSEGKEAELKRMIEVRYKKNLELFQKPYVSLEELMEEDLPDLDYENNIVWQKTLLRELIDRMEQTLFLGSYREVVIFRDADGGIECLEDVVWYLLKHKYKGAANLKDLESRLHKDQIVKTLQPAMFSKQKVEISGREIFINEMKN